MPFTARSLNKSRMVGHRFQCAYIQATTKEIKESTKKIPPAKQIAATNTITTTTQTTVRTKRRENTQKQREPYEVAVTMYLLTPNNELEKTIANMHAREITKRCQDISDAETVEKPKLNGNKITNGIQRLQCNSLEDAKIPQYHDKLQ